ncbi:MAG TPA: hypothetical protein VFJ72_02200 [Rubrobacteraceae bacterium]|nr:hypothetical protein [Rubrobacteraceae bacterium]
MSRERFAFGLLIFVLITLFAITFFVLGRGEYEPGASAEPVVAYVLG